MFEKIFCRGNLRIALLCVVAVFCTLQTVHSESDSTESLFHEMNESVLKPYISPLVTSLGTGMGSGLFYRADVHRILGFDFSVKAMWIPIPENAKTHTYKVMKLCADTVNQKIDTTYVPVTGSTIFGPGDEVTVPVDSYEIAIPSKIPEGIDFPGMAFAAPQLNIGLPFRTEVMVRWIPPIAVGKGENVEKISFFGAGLKWEITSLFERRTSLKKPSVEKDTSAPIDTLTVQETPEDTLLSADTSTVEIEEKQEVKEPEEPAKPVKVKQSPFSLAIQGAYQQVKFGDIVKLTTQSVNIQMCYKLGILRPYIGLGLEGTNLHVKYDFEYEMPDTANLGNTITETRPIETDINGENGFRATVGFAIEKFIYLHADYNFGKYPSFNAGIGFSVR